MATMPVISSGRFDIINIDIMAINMETIPNDIKVFCQPKFFVINVASNGDRPPEMFAEALNTL
ncbi:hypothetical protein DERP_007037 [Dermatophagoides pteronyssinus]|uniref:Uncharacterized protein n=1 Tax=Dermatophagoides pteronyssinus TaxID=6956 RepID=A0ABQ8JU73_DERPT|nr:hypothetical protein DERP_007037 [Dermatophagoides pteronyssinus]